MAKTLEILPFVKYIQLLYLFFPLKQEVSLNEDNVLSTLIIHVDSCLFHKITTLLNKDIC